MTAERAQNLINTSKTKDSPESVEIARNNSARQALYMARFAGIELTPEQIGWYVEHRLGIFKHKTPEEPSISIDLSDQQLFDRIPTLTPEQRRIFRPHFPGVIFPPDIN